MSIEDKEACTKSHCRCGDPDTCEAMEAHKKLIYCKFYGCLWNISIDPGVHIKHHKDWKPIGEVDRYKGLCGRSEVGIVKTEYNRTVDQVQVAECGFRSDKGLKGHMDFSRLLQSDGSPYGGTI